MTVDSKIVKAIIWTGLIFFWANLARVYILVASNDPLWLDELHSEWVVDGGFGELLHRAAQGNQTPMYYWIAQMFRIGFGDSHLILRLGSILSVTATGIMLPIVVERRTTDTLAALFASLFFGLSSSTLFYATEARPYGLLMLVGFVHFTFFCRCFVEQSIDIENRRKRLLPWGFTVILTAIFLVAIHPLGILLLLVEWGVFSFFVAAIWLKQGRELAKRLLTCQVYLLMAILISAIPVLLLPFNFANRNLWRMIADPLELLVWFGWQSMWLALPIVVAVVFRSNFFSGKRVVGHFSILSFSWCLAVGYVLLVLACNIFELAPLANIRYVVVVLPVLSLAGAMAISTLRNFWLKLAILGTILIGLTLLPQPMMLESKLVWNNQRHWVINLAITGRVSQIRMEDWAKLVEELDHRISQTKKPTYLMANILEDANLKPGTSDEQVELRKYLQFPLVLASDKPWVSQIESRRTLNRPRFSKKDIDQMSKTGGAWLIVRVDDVTLRDIEDEIREAANASERNLTFVDLGPPSSNVRLIEFTID